MKAGNYNSNFFEKVLKVTHQRTSVLEAIFIYNNHPRTDKIINYIRKSHPNIATATTYNGS